MAVIYKATNKVNGKSYIGFAVDFDKRKKEHKRKSIQKNKQYFHYAIFKYGYENFDWEILKENACFDDEKYFILKYETYWEQGKGYNLTIGGEGKLGFKTTEETRKKISESHKKIPVTEERLLILRRNAEKMKESGHTEETKRKISESHKGRKFTEEHKKNISINHASKKDTGSYYQSKEYKEKMSKALKGKKRTPEQIERYRMAAKRRAENKRTLQGF